MCNDKVRDGQTFRDNQNLPPILYFRSTKPTFRECPQLRIVSARTGASPPPVRAHRLRLYGRITSARTGASPPPVRAHRLRLYGRIVSTCTGASSPPVRVHRLHLYGCIIYACGIALRNASDAEKIFRAEHENLPSG
jgi:hypothetical protein